MAPDQKIFSAKCKGCGKEFEFVDEGVKVEQASPSTFHVHQAFDPEFPGTIRHGECGDISSYEPTDIRLVGKQSNKPS